MSKVTLNLPVNAVSLGFVGYQLLRQFEKNGVDFDFSPIGNQLDFSSFNKAPNEFIQKMTHKAQNFHSTYSRNNPCFRLWHINGSESSIGNGSHLLTFHELDALTPTEVNILNNQTQVFVTSEESKQVFEDYGVKVPVTFVPLGYDTEHFYRTNKKYLGNDLTVFLIHGKVEKRKATERAIKGWAAKFGNNPKYRLHAQIFNPFFTPEQNNQVINQILGGKQYDNINFFSYFKTLGELNDLYNASDIVIDLSNGEGHSLPSYHTVGLGKHAIIHNNTGMKGWATKENAVLIESTGKQPAADGVFFAQDGPFNIGNIYDFSQEDYLAALDEVVKRKVQNKVNITGLELPEKFTWENTFKIIKEKMGI